MRKLIISIAAAVAVVGVLSMGALTPSADAASYWGGTSSTTRYSPLLGSTQTTWSNGMSATSRYSPLLGSTQTTWSNGMSATSRYSPLLGSTRTTYSGYGYGG
jgi:hypothetical protein